MTVRSSLFRFAIGNLVGVLALIVFLTIHGTRLDYALSTAGLWFPISCFYALIVIAVSRRLVEYQSRGLLLLLGGVVALFPPLSGFWPVYWMPPGYAAVMVGIHLTVLAIVVAAWLLFSKLFKRRL